MEAIESLIATFLHLLNQTGNPKFYTRSLSLAKAIVRQNQKVEEAKGTSSGLDHKKLLEKLDNVRNTTHAKINLPLAMVENIVNTVRPLDYTEEGEWFDNNNKKLRRKNGKPYRTIDLATYLDESYDDVIDVVQEVSMGYSIDLPMWGGGSSNIGPPDISQ